MDGRTSISRRRGARLMRSAGVPLDRAGAVIGSLLLSVVKLGIPDGAPARLRGGAQVFFGLTLWCWGLTLLLWDSHIRQLILVLASIATICTVVCWANAIRSDEDQRTLIRLCGDLLDRLPDDGRPPLLREA